ncbi:hypothetical protein PI124_g14919 [Phytophthora idaei]|nr:hypothetical protein PI126_g14886 [Phytophthora idaei]KAG3240177.1 hypothetical protein PI124_g14919 [Phytophthora idaei]
MRTPKRDEVGKAKEPAASTQVLPDRPPAGPWKTGSQSHEPSTTSPDRDVGEEQVCISEEAALFAEDVEIQMAALLEVTTTADEVKFEDIPIENAGRSTSEDVERLRRIVGSRRHLLL